MGIAKKITTWVLCLVLAVSMLPAASLTAHAATQYTVTVSASPAAGGTVRIVSGSITDATSVTVYDGNQIHVYAEPAEGYHFVRWVENGATVVNGSTPMEGYAWSDFIYNVYENRDFVAEFASNYCELTLSADPVAGGTVKTVNNTPSGTFNYNSAQNIYAVPSVGYKFVGWYENGQPATCLVNTTYTDQDARVHLLKDTTLVAVFEAVANKHTVSAEPAEGGTVWINSRGTTEVAIGSMAKAYAEANTGYKFVGWYENGTKVYEGTDYLISSKDPARNLVAKFEVDGYTVTWKSQDGSSTLETDSGLASGAAPSFDGAEPTKAEDARYTYTFAGWATSANAESGTAEDALPTVSGDATYYAAFSKTAKTPDVYVGGVGMFSGDYLAVGATETSLTMPENGCYAYYNNGVLTLKNYSYNGVGYEYSEDLYAVIYAPKEITILLSSVNTLTQTDSTYGSVIQLAKGGTFRGSNVSGGSAGELVASGGQMGIYADSGDIVVNGGTLNISNCAYGLNSETYYEGSVVINDGTLNISATNFAIKAYNVDVNYGDVTARCTNTVTQYDANYYAICADYFSFDNCTPKASVNSTGNPLVGYFLFNDVPTYDYIALEPHFAVSFLVDGEVYATEYAETGMTVTPPADPEVSGRRFIGWYTQTGDAFDFTTAITQNVELYAEFGEPEMITNVTLSVTAPVSGEHPSYTVTLPDGANYSHFIQEGFYKDEFWWDATAGKGLAETDTFISGHRYIVHVYLKAAVNYGFPEDESQITATVASDESVILDTIGDYNQYLKVTFVLTATEGSQSSGVTVNCIGDIDYTVSGNVVTVDHEVACKVGYLDGTAHKAITAVANGDGTYSFTAPAGVTEVLLVVKGDVSGDGYVTAADKMTVARSLLLTTHPAYQALNTIQTFAGDMDNNGSVIVADKMTLARSMLLTTHPAYQALIW